MPLNDNFMEKFDKNVRKRSFLRLALNWQLKPVCDSEG